MIEHLRHIMDKLATLPETEQEMYATQIEAELQENQRIASQLTDPNETDLDHLLTRADEQSAQGKVHDLDVIL